MPNDGGAAPAPLTEGRFDGREAFADLVREALAAAASQGWNEIVFSDPDFVDWPLGERASIEALQAWSGRGRRLLLLAGRFDLVERGHARFVTWRRTWDHIVECRATGGRAGATEEVPSALWTPTWCLRRIDPERSRGVCSSEARARRDLRESVDERWRQGRPAFAASTLGL
ncbi:hypothetical protein [Acidovorax cavernicola]|uniref:Uncharacterized protein n=1 Tax=Acidovorax cavernicola TaxID=1675792 RepID=A0A9X8D662_9BURK|nr:hypothetical protein [Acidovorax cavernicola]RIX81652.1 hypothetical protein D3H34_10165 [Acidovorax cavernicola]